MKEIKVKCLLPVRLDKYLQQQFPTLTPGKLNKALRENKIKLNKKKQPLSTRVVPGDLIELYILDDQLYGSAPVDGPAYLAARCPAEIVYEDDNFLIANKPAGLPVDDLVEADTLINRVLLGISQNAAAAPSGYTPQLCHRLDTGTSGLVIVAKNAKTQTFMEEAIRKRDLRKFYYCVTFGRPNPASDTLQGWMVKDAQRGIVYVDRKKSENAKEIITKYETVAVSGRMALLKVELITGRTHQIRAHLNSIGCPILGDSKYGNNAVNREMKMKYQALCACEIDFPASVSSPMFSYLGGKKFYAPKPWYFAQVLDGTLK